MKRQEIGGAGEQKTPNKKQTPKNPTKTQTTKIEKEWKEKKKNRPDIYKFGYDTTPINPKLAGDQ